MQEVDVILTIELCGYTCCVRPCIVMLDSVMSVILHEMTNYLLCMNPVQTSNNGCRLK